MQHKNAGGYGHTEQLFKLEKQDWALLCEFRKIMVGRHCMQAPSAGWGPGPLTYPVPARFERESVEVMGFP